MFPIPSGHLVLLITIMINFQADPETIEQLRSDLESLVSELADLSHRNDELMNAKEADLAVIHNLDMQLKEYKRKYETAKTELRSFKGASNSRYS